MKSVVLLVLVVAAAGAALRMAGTPLPLIDYPVGPIGVDTPGPAMPNVQIEPPGFDDFPAP